MSEIGTHGGNRRLLARKAGIPPDELLDFSASIHPLGPPEGVGEALLRALRKISWYPDPWAEELVGDLADYHQVDPAEVVAGNGATELLFLLPLVLRPDRAVIPAPSYMDYARAALLSGLSVESCLLKEKKGFELDMEKLAGRLRSGDLVFLGQPNNPTGRLFDPDRFRWAARQCADCFFVVDEAFADFVEGYVSLIEDRPGNVVILRSMTKFFAFPGLRLGYLVADQRIAEQIRSRMPPWSVNLLAQAAGRAALADAGYAEKVRSFVRRQREWLEQRLSGIRGVTPYPGSANFLLVRFDGGDVGELAGRLLLEHGIAVRTCAGFEGLDGRYFRIAVRTFPENERLCQALETVLEER